MPVPLNLPSVPLLLTGLPNFNLGPFPSSPSLDSEFTFSAPIVVKEVISTTSKNNFKPFTPYKKSDLSQPAVASSKPSISSKLSASFNIPKDSNNKLDPNTSNSKVKSVQTIKATSSPKPKTVSASPASSQKEPPKVTNSFGDLFKVAPGSWACEVCDVRNKSEAKSCVACSTSRPGASQKKDFVPAAFTKASTPQLPVITQPGFGSQFTKGGKWECDMCMLLNDYSLDKCPSCMTPKPGSTQSLTPQSIPPFKGFGSQFTNWNSAPIEMIWWGRTRNTIVSTLNIRRNSKGRRIWWSSSKARIRRRTASL